MISIYRCHDGKVSATTVLIMRSADSNVLINDSSRMTQCNASSMLRNEMYAIGVQCSDS